MIINRLLEKRDGTSEMVEACLDYVRNSTSVIIFGAGVGGASVYKLLKKIALSQKLLEGLIIT